MPNEKPKLEKWWLIWLVGFGSCSRHILSIIIIIDFSYFVLFSTLTATSRGKSCNRCQQFVAYKPDEIDIELRTLVIAIEFISQSGDHIFDI